MVSDIRERGRTALDHLSENQLPAVVRWLELLADLKDHPDLEPEEILLLATGELKQMDEEMGDAIPIEDWRRYLDEL
jgi:hypothetical protein